MVRPSRARLRNVVTTKNAAALHVSHATSPVSTKSIQKLQNKTNKIYIHREGNASPSPTCVHVVMIGKVCRKGRDRKGLGMRIEVI